MLFLYNEMHHNADVSWAAGSQSSPSFSGTGEGQRMGKFEERERMEQSGKFGCMCGLFVGVAGGRTPDELNQVMLPVIDRQVCNQTGWYGGDLDDSMICAGYAEGGRDTCQVIQQQREAETTTTTTTTKKYHV